MFSLISAIVISIVGFIIVIYCQRSLSNCNEGEKIIGTAIECKEEIIQNPIQQRFSDKPVTLKNKKGEEIPLYQKVYRTTYALDKSYYTYGIPDKIVDQDTTEEPVILGTSKEFILCKDNKFYNEDSLKGYRKSGIFLILFGLGLAAFEVWTSM